MKIDQISNFILRANYPNYKCSEFFCNNYLNSISSADTLEGYISPEIEYVIKPGDLPLQTEVNYLDIPFLCESDKEKSKEYLVYLLNAKEGDVKSQNYLKRINQRYYEELNKKNSSTTFVENEYVVPSISTKKHPIKLVSHKGANLLTLTKEGFPVPDFCILTSKSYLLSPEKRYKHLESAISNLEKLTGQKIDSSGNPLIFAMRCAMPAYIPGLMPTYLNVGVTDKIYVELKNMFGLEVANKIYHNNLKTIHAILYPEHDNIICAKKDNGKQQGCIEEMIDFYHKQISDKNKNLLTNAYDQFTFFVQKAEDFFNDNQDLIYTFQKGEKVYPSIILQKMVWTVRDDDSHPGVLYSRHSRTGLGMQIESVKNIFGEDIMTGLINTEHTEFFNRAEIKDLFPAIYHFSPLVSLLEKKHKSPATIEFAAESFKERHFFAILQLDKSELTGRATLLSAIDLYQHKIINKKMVVKLIQPYHLRQIFSERIDDESLKKLQFFCHGISILPRSAVSVRAYFSANKVIEAKRSGEKVCFCKSTFNPTDRMVLSEVDAILSLTPTAIHVVTACLGYGIPALINLENYNSKIINNTLVNEQGLVINEGDWITISSKLKMLFIGKANYKPARFQKYLEGQQIELEPKEAAVFVNMEKAFREYQKIVNSLKSGDITELSDLVKLIRNDLQKNPNKAEKFVNKWFDKHFDYYIHQILKSDLGSHIDQHRLYSLLTIDRRVRFFKNIIQICKNKGLKGYKAGAFMLGRFMCLSQPIDFWKEFSPDEIIFLLNEYVLIQKYIQLLYDFGEKNINKVRNEILNFGLGSIILSIIDAKVFISLKLCVKNWESINKLITSSFDKETKVLLDLLQMPYGDLYEYDKPWSLNNLQDTCKSEQINIPNKDSA